MLLARCVSRFLSARPGHWESGVLCALFSFLLCGCQEYYLYPVDARQEITLRQSGAIEMRYSGEFRDTYVEIMEFIRRAEKSQGKTNTVVPENYSPAHYRDALLEKLRAIPVRPDMRMDVTALGSHRYRMDYQEQIAANALYGNAYLSDKPKDFLIQFGVLEAKGQKGVIELLTTQHEIDELRKESVDAEMRHAIKPLLQAIGRIRGTLVIRTDGRVTRHNAGEVRQGSDGLTEYLWQMKGDTLDQPRFTVFIGENDADYHQHVLDTAQTAADCQLLDNRTREHRVCLLKVAPAGTLCRDIIGENCECGPFKIALHNGEPSVNTHYEITHSQGKTTGCTNAEGEIPSVTSPVTGPCRVTILGKCEPAGGRGTGNPQ